MEELSRILLKWLKPILIVCAISAVGSAIISLTLPEYFKSTVTFLTANPHALDRESLFKMEIGDHPVYLYGGGNDNNRILTLAESRHVENYLIDKFNLYEHYEVDSLEPLAEFEVKEELRDHFKVLKTVHGNLQIEVTDKDKDFAATMANDVITRLDELNMEVIRRKKYDVLKVYEKHLTEQKDEVEKWRDSLQSIIQINPDDTVSYNVVESLVNSALGQYTSVKIIYEQYLPALQTKWSTIYILEEAVPAVKRFKPVRSMIVLTGVLLSLLVMVIISVFVEKYRELT